LDAQYEIHRLGEILLLCAGGLVPRVRNSSHEPVWAALDQGISSLTNFILFVFVARDVSSETFGHFSLAFVAYVLAIGSARSLAGEALLVRALPIHKGSFQYSVKGQSGATTLVGVTFGLVLLAIAVSLPSSNSAIMVSILAITLPFLLLQDAARVALVAGRRARDALANDLMWCVLFLGIAILRPFSQIGVSIEVLVYWATTGCLAAGMGLFQLHVLPSLKTGIKWILQHRDLGVPYLAEFTIVTGSQQMLLGMVAMVSGAASVGALKGAQLLLGPVNMLFTPAVLVGVGPAVQSRSQSGEAGLKRFCIRISTILFGLGLFWTLALLLIPDGVGRSLLGLSWAGAQPLLVPIGVSVALAGSAVGALVGLRSLAAATCAVRVRFVVGLLMLFSGIVGAILWGAMGTAIGLAVVSGIGIIVWWHSFSAVLSDAHARHLGPTVPPSD
jgi:hypothetical protein